MSLTLTTGSQDGSETVVLLAKLGWGIGAPLTYIAGQIGEEVGGVEFGPEWLNTGLAGVSVLGIIYLVREIISGRLVAKATLDAVTEQAVNKALDKAEERFDKFGRKD